VVVAVDGCGDVSEKQGLEDLTSECRSSPLSLSCGWTADTEWSAPSHEVTKKSLEVELTPMASYKLRVSKNQECPYSTAFRVEQDSIDNSFIMHHKDETLLKWHQIVIRCDLFALGQFPPTRCDDGLRINLYDWAAGCCRLTLRLDGLCCISFIG